MDINEKNNTKIVIEDMYEGMSTRVRRLCRGTQNFSIRVGRSVSRFEF